MIFNNVIKFLHNIPDQPSVGTVISVLQLELLCQTLVDTQLRLGVPVSPHSPWRKVYNNLMWEYKLPGWSSSNYEPITMRFMWV